ncbi:MAG: hypothetical protein CMJ19_15105 [Phycisphaeraceae bacterium]|nr:hypothetical protein [Phycisphaeraceae bacterium]
MKTNSENGQAATQWRQSDTIIVVVQLILPVVAILVVQFYPSSTNWNSDVKLSIIALGLIAPIIIQQVANSVAQNTNVTAAARIENRLEELDEKISHVNPMLERAFLSANDKIVRFALRRAGEVNTLIKYAIDNQRSGNLKPREYYEELDYLAHLIIRDRTIKKEDFTGEIWAMTSFAPDEWINDDGYEGLWIDTLQSMVDTGIRTKRICIVPSDLIDLIGSESFSVPKDMPQFPGFIKLLQDYYGTGNKKEAAQHYIIRDTTNTDLTRTAGFFAIRLSNGEMHILTGETIDKYGSITAEALFDENKIRQFSDLCHKFMTEKYAIENVIKDVAKPNGFGDYLLANGVNLV